MDFLMNIYKGVEKVGRLDHNLENAVWAIAMENSDYVSLALSPVNQMNYQGWEYDRVTGHRKGMVIKFDI